MAEVCVSDFSTHIRQDIYPLSLRRMKGLISGREGLKFNVATLALFT